jgi:hypothetical protein
LEKRDGFLPMYLDVRQGRLLFELPRDAFRSLLFITQATGLGSNPIGIDRGTSVDNQVVRFDRNGTRVLVVLENLTYRSSATGNPAHLRTIGEAFPASTIGSLPILAEEGGRLLVDATDFVFRDWTDIAATLATTNEGSYFIARDWSSIVADFTKAFPANSEIDIALTFATNGRPGPTVSAIVPDGHAFTVRDHLSFLELPGAGFRPREQDPRVGFFGISFKDYAQPLQGSLDQHWIARRRMERMNPNDPTSPIRNPIVYYVDRGIPEPLRTATLQGVGWWTQVFDAAGLRGGFRVELLPEGVDPMDARYNVVQWINRNERGWSVGGSLGDPRTGEIIKGMARMDSHRNRTDYNLYAGLMGADPSASDTAFVLARVRQVSAHEVGHTLGLAHNYIASTYDRGSVMDYPPPRVRLDASGNIDISDAYAKGPAPYDVWAVHWGYGIFPAATEADSLRAIVADGLKKGYLYLSDNDARPEYASDPRTSLWDDGATGMDFLKTEMDVRRVAMAKFGERNIRPGEALALLQDRFVPVYFMHRFGIASAAKAIGGMEYAFAMRGDGQQATRPVPGAQQRAALRLLSHALDPAELAIPDTLVTLFGPRPAIFPQTAELFGSRARPAFDELSAAQTLANMVLEAALQRDRAARLVQFAARGGDPLTLSETIDSLVAATWSRPSPATAKLQALQRVAQRAVTDRLLLLASDREATPQVRALADYKLAALRDVARRRATADRIEMARAEWGSIAGDITRWLERKELPAPTIALRAPPGDPFGLGW